MPFQSKLNVYRRSLDGSGSYVRTNKRTRQPCRISEIINSALKTFSHSPKSINVKFSLEVPSDLVVEGDPLELELVFINLFETLRMR